MVQFRQLCHACAHEATRIDHHPDRLAPFDLVQLLYPDRNGFMPYETGYDQRMRLAQPVVGTLAEN